jgi:hypothetical protein
VLQRSAKGLCKGYGINPTSEAPSHNVHAVEPSAAPPANFNSTFAVEIVDGIKIELQAELTRRHWQFNNPWKFALVPSGDTLAFSCHDF